MVERDPEFFICCPLNDPRTQVLVSIGGISSRCDLFSTWSQTRENQGASTNLPPLTLRSGLRPVGPGSPRTSLLLLQGCPDIALQAVGLLLKQTYPDTLNQGHGGPSGHAWWSRRTSQDL